MNYIIKDHTKEKRERIKKEYLKNTPTFQEYSLKIYPEAKKK